MIYVCKIRTGEKLNVCKFLSLKQSKSNEHLFDSHVV